MKRVVMVVSSVALLCVSVSASVGGGALAATKSVRPAARAHAVMRSRIPGGLHAQQVCPASANPRMASCLAMVLADATGRPFTSPAPAGLGPADFQDAYKLPSSDHGDGVTVAIVDAYHDPNAEADLAVYRSTFGLPACTTANGCFTQVTSRGNHHWPRTNSLWALETSLDLDAVSAVCPNCNILLVESYGGWLGGLGKAVNEAVKLGADVVSNSYANRTKDKNEVYGEKYYNHPGTAIVAGTGDWGYNYYKSYPAASQYVIAAGGTFLQRDQSQRGWHETAWAGAGSGCAPLDPKPKWQKDDGCGDMRTYADVSADASPASGAAVYDTFGHGGWIVVGGTSLASPLIAGVFALAGDSITYGKRVYQDPDQLFDITSGSNGSCNGSYLCTAGPGYDGPTGLGTPNGIGDF
jgi:subtilase family serine protease